MYNYNLNNNFQKQNSYLPPLPNKKINNNIQLHNYNFNNVKPFYLNNKNNNNNLYNENNMNNNIKKRAYSAYNKFNNNEYKIFKNLNNNNNIYSLNTYLSPIKTEEIQYNPNNINKLDNQYSKYNVEAYCSNIEKLKTQKLFEAKRDFELYQNELLKDKLRKKKLKRLYSKQLEHQIITNYEKKIEKYEDFSNRRRIKNKLMLDSYINSYENSLKLENQYNKIYKNNYY